MQDYNNFVRTILTPEKKTLHKLNSSTDSDHLKI